LASTWISYNELAWTENLLANSEEYKEEVMFYIELIQKNSSAPVKTLLHFGCGAGSYDTFFKKHFTVTGVDLSKGMLEIARNKHPDIEYIEGDMKTINLNRQFHIIVIPDSIDYMTTENDLFQTISNAVLHLKTGGVLLIGAKTKETFRNNNFAYTGEKGDLNVTLLENNYINTFKPNTYEAAIMYLIRNKGELSVYTENQILGLFSEATWEKLFNNAGLKMQKVILSDMYKKYILDSGEYPLTIFIGKK
jgi:ubiquinone/menaquinone biosynthesis C-methylase UbiE